MKVVDKPWGKEEWLEVNDNYTVKRISVLQGHQCSLQYHEIKKETMFVLEGILNLYIEYPWDKGRHTIHKLHPGQYFTINPGVIHRSIGVEGDVVFLESSTSELDDVIRIEDDYKRV